jgi:hypothetical protein
MWQAILLGQATEPAWESYWDPDSGDVAEAVQGASDAFDLTVPEIYEEDCDVVELVASFKAGKTVTVAIPAGVWTTVPWEYLVYDLNTPNFNLAVNEHKPVNADLMGLWQYNVCLACTTGLQTFGRAIERPGVPGSQEIATVSSMQGVIGFGFEYNWSVTGKGIAIQYWSAVATTLEIVINICHFSGHKVGYTAEP